MNYKVLAERLNVCPLTEEEKQKRGILGRLFGPIATSLERTRNGRKYNKELWERALNDELFNEKIANKCLFLELGHPVDREEVDMTKVCACIPEMPKIIDGDLCAYVDILDTPNGKILKTLCDYGFVPGISSRGSGDVLANDDVDPETFFLETFDIVNIPAVKKARLSMCESLNASKNKSLKQALTESMNTASQEDQAIMKEALDKLNIEVEDEAAELAEADDIPWASDAFEDVEVLTEADDEEVAQEAAEEDTDGEEVPAEDAAEDTEEPVNTEEAEEPESEDADAPEETEANTIGEFVELLNSYNQDLNLVIEIIDEDEVEHTYDTFTITETEDTLKISAIRSAAEDADEAGAEDIYELEETEEEIPEAGAEAADEPTEAEDTGDEEVIESLKDLVRQNNALEEEAKTLRAEKAVGDAKVEELQEELDKYKAAFSRVSAVAAGSKKLSRKVETLQEQLSLKDAENSTLRVQVAKARQLNESVDASSKKVQSLTEALTKERNERTALEESYKAKLASSEAKLNSRTETAKKYRARFTEAMTHYVANKADMLGVDPTEITSKLTEAYTVADVDAICEQLMTSASFSRLPFGGITRSKACIKEPTRAKAAPKSPENGYDIDDSLLELAGLK